MQSLLRPLPFLLVVLAACASGPGSEPLGETTAALDTYPNEQPAFDYFLAKGLTPAQSAGIVGNFDIESGVDPTIVQQGGGPGRGIAQWSTGARWDTTQNDNVKAYAVQQGESATSLQLQLEFTWYELTTFPDYGLAKLKATTDAATATSTFAEYFEGCGACNTSDRIAHAQSVLSRFGTDAPDGSASSGVPTGPACTIANGDMGVCISTSDCAAEANHVSTAGFCPGSSDIQCCTSTGGGGSSASSSSGSSGSTSSSGSASSSGDSSSNHAASQDVGGCSASPRSAGGGGFFGLLLAGLLVVTRRRR